MSNEQKENTKLGIHIFVGVCAFFCAALFWDMHNAIYKTSEQVQSIRERLVKIETKLGI